MLNNIINSSIPKIKDLPGMQMGAQERVQEYRDVLIPVIAKEIKKMDHAPFLSILSF